MTSPSANKNTGMPTAAQRDSKSKDDLALSVAAHWEAMTAGFFTTAPYHKPANPLDRLLGYLEFRGAILTGEQPDYKKQFGPGPSHRCSSNGSRRRHSPRQLSRLTFGRVAPCEL